MTKCRNALIGNIIIFALAAFAVGWIMFAPSSGPLTGPNLAALKYYTVDSNILMGLAAFLSAIFQLRGLSGKHGSAPAAVLILKLAGTVSVTLTMLVTIFFLGPTMGRVYGFFSLFAGANLFLHLIIPVLSILIYLTFERESGLPLKHSFTAVIPTVIYAVYYVAVTFAHVDQGTVQPGYDWYGFLALGLSSAVIVLPLILTVTWLISFVLWKINRRHS